MSFNQSYTLAMVGCGNMGQAMLRGFLKNNMLEACHIVHPRQSKPPIHNDRVFMHKSVTTLPDNIDIIIFAVKPQVMFEIIADYQSFIMRCNPVVLSVAAGVSIGAFENCYGTDAAIARVMPNTPCAIVAGITALYANENVTKDQKNLVEQLMNAIGMVVWIDDEDKMHVVTGLSGSGPAYVFYMIEAMAAAGIELGLKERDAMNLARQTVIGAAKLAEAEKNQQAETLRKNVTSSGGTTEAGLDVLMHSENGLHDLMLRTINKAAQKSRELSKND